MKIKSKFLISSNFQTAIDCSGYCGALPSSPFRIEGLIPPAANPQFFSLFSQGHTAFPGAAHIR